MKNLIATICLTVAVLLGSAGVNYASSKGSEGLPYWAGLIAEIDGNDSNWSLVIDYSMDGTSYVANIDYNGRADCTVQGKVSGTGTLEKTECDIGGVFFRTFSGNVEKMNLEDMGGWGGSDFIDIQMSSSRRDYQQAKATNQSQAAETHYASERNLIQETEGLPYLAGHEKRIIGETGTFPS